MTHAPAANGDASPRTKKHPDIDGGWGWWVVFASFAIHIVSEYSTILFNYNCSIYIMSEYSFEFRHIILSIIAKWIYRMNFLSLHIDASAYRERGILSRLQAPIWFLNVSSEL